MPYGKPKKAKVKEMSTVNKIRTFLGKDPLPKASAKDAGFAGSRLKNKKKKY